MFDDSLISLMIMLLLCFMGMLVMFLFVIRSLSSQSAVLREGFVRQQNALADIEQQVMDMNFALRKLQKTSNAHAAAEGLPDSLSGAGSGPNLLQEALGASVMGERGVAPDGQHPFGQGAVLPVTGGTSGSAGREHADLFAGASDAGASGNAGTEAYGYPSAAGLDPLDDTVYGGLFESLDSGKKKEKQQPAGLNLKLEP